MPRANSRYTIVSSEITWEEKEELASICRVEGSNPSKVIARLIRIFIAQNKAIHRLEPKNKIEANQ